MIYERFCPICRKRTLQRITKINRLKGVKFECLLCMNETKRYSKLNDKAERRKNLNDKSTQD